VLIIDLWMVAINKKIYFNFHKHKICKGLWPVEGEKMKEKNEKKDNLVPAEKAPYEKPQLHNYGKLENLVSAIPEGKVLGGPDHFSAIGHGKP
jgi:hypothetical protein